MTYNIADIIKDEVSGKADYVSQDVYVDRLNKCQKCEHLTTLIPLAGRKL